MDCNWKLDGQPMDPLKVGDKKDLSVSPGEHVIQASTTDGMYTIRTTFNTTRPTQLDIDHGTFWVAIELQRLQKLHVEIAREPMKAETAQSLIWTDAGTGLTWTSKDNGSDLDWNEANAYCSNLQLAGYKDWRLPTIEELQGIYDPNVSIQTVFDAGVFRVHVKGNLNLTGWEWSSAQGDAPGKPSRGEASRVSSPTA